MSEATHYLSTRLEFVDRLEGQILRVGSRRSCEELMERIPAVAYSGEDALLGASLVVREVPTALVGKVSPGQVYRIEKEQR